MCACVCAHVCVFLPRFPAADGAGGRTLGFCVAGADRGQGTYDLGARPPDLTPCHSPSSGC